MARRSTRRVSATFGSRTDVGCVREHNEDSLIVAPPLFVVCDGMGGHAAGEVASEIAVNTIAKRVPHTPDATALGQAVEEANLAIMRAAEEGVGREGMGTTCTAAMLENERLVIAQAGDSRAYLLHQGKLQQLTRDHSLVADLVESGQITQEEARVHPMRSVITRALGSNPRMQPDLFEINVETGDRLLLCSDGLTSMIEDDEIAAILNRTADPQLAASQLVNAAITAGGYDNVTVVVVNVTGFAEVRRRKLARKTKITVAILFAMLAAICAAAVAGFTYFSTHSAYLIEQDGKVAIYEGIPGEVLGMSFSHLSSVTDVEVDDLQPGVANRLRGEGVRADSVEDAEALVESYREEIAERQQEEKSSAASTVSTAQAKDESASNPAASDEAAGFEGGDAQ